MTNLSIDAEIEMLKEELETKLTFVRQLEIYEQLDQLEKQRLADECDEEARDNRREEDYMDIIDDRDADEGFPENDNQEML